MKGNWILFIMFFVKPVSAQFPVMQSYQYPTNEALDNMNCNVFYGGNGRIYASPYNNGLFEISNTGMRRIPAPPRSTIQSVEGLSESRLLLAGNSGLWISDLKGSLHCLDSAGSYSLKRHGAYYYYIRVKNNQQFEICLLDSSLSINVLFQSFQPLAFHSFRDSLLIQVSGIDSSQMYVMRSDGLQPFKKIKLASTQSILVGFIEQDTYILCTFEPGNQTTFCWYKNGVLIKRINACHMTNQTIHSFVAKLSQGLTQVLRFDGSPIGNINLSEIKIPGSYIEAATLGGLFFSGQSTIVRTFTYLHQYPKLFKKDNSRKIFSLVESPDHIILAGSFQDGLMGIRDTGYVSFDLPEQRITNGSFKMPGRAIVLPEGGAHTHFNLFEPGGKIRNINYPPLTSFFVGYYSRSGRLYFGSAQKGLWYTDTTSFLENKPAWQKIDSNQNDRLTNILTITEDTLGRLWYAHPQNGIGIYSPESNKTEYFLKSKNDIPYGAMASVTDHNGTVWLGTRPGGLVWYNAYNSTIRASDLHRMEHPLFNNSQEVTALCLYKNHLLISAYDKILVLNLDSFYAGKTNLKYLSKQETNFNSFTEQNTLMAASDDGIWFSTHDNLFRWDFDTWFNLPKEKIHLNTILHHLSYQDTLRITSSSSIPPTQNSFSIDLDYYTADLLPRYLRTALQFEEDSLHWSRTDIETHFNFSNLKPGRYTFHVEVMELDGTLSNYAYPLKINSFWYKTGWFWSSFLACIFFVIFILQRRFHQKNLTITQLQLETELTRKGFAEEINAKEKTLAQLRLQNIANQIRPHFILNALNVIGAALPGKSKAEALLNHLSTSMRSLFKQSIQNKNTHSFETEWMLCLNTVEMYRTMYLPDLNFEAKLSSEEFVSLEVPINLLQIPLENALLHGLRNSTLPEKELHISCLKTSTSLTILIEDNGIGRKAANNQSNARKNGTGLRNLSEALTIYNSFNTEKILFEIEDLKPRGTVVRITLPFNYRYDI